MFKLSSADYPRFMKRLDEMNKNYDPTYRAIKVPFSSPGYHTTLKDGFVHSTRTAFQYALALLDSGDENYLVRAQEVLRGVIPLQETNPAEATYGIWSWFYEEPLSQMSPPDWNWADFCGKEMLMIELFHGHRLAADLRAMVKESIRHACLSIFRRNMHPGYTNISIMGSYVTLLAGEYFGWEEIFHYGKKRFENFCTFTRLNGAFAEYNSPTYTIVALEDLTRIADHVKNETIHALAVEMIDIAWFTIATHFHAPTRQWAGPHARAYHWLQDQVNLSLIQRGTKDQVVLVDEKDYHLDIGWTHIDLTCPKKYFESFRTCAPHDAGICYGQVGTHLRSIDEQPAVANCYLNEDFALGTFERSNAWNQCRNLLAHWGGKQQCFMSLRVLNDFYDFCSGRMLVAQKEGMVLTTISFVSDGGNTHVNLDPIVDAAIETSDLRIRFDLGNLNADIQSDGNNAWVTAGGMNIAVQLIGGDFEGNPVTLMVPNTKKNPELATAFAAGQSQRLNDNEKDRRYIDIVFYHGEKRKFRLDRIESAFASFALCLSKERTFPTDVSLQVEGGIVKSSAAFGKTKLETVAQAAILPVKELKSKAYADGLDLDEKYRKPIKA